MDFEAFSMQSNMYTVFQSKHNTRIQTMKWVNFTKQLNYTGFELT